VIPSGLSAPLGTYGAIQSTTTAGTCNVTGTASGGYSGVATATSVVTTQANRLVLPVGLLVAPSGSAAFTVSVTGPTPTAPVTVSLSTVNSGIATVAATATIPAGSTSTSVAINGVAAGSTSLSATDGGGSGYVGTTTVVTVKTITMSLSPSGAFTASAVEATTRQVQLSDAAPAGGVVVSLVIADTTKATLSTSSVVIPAGQLLSPSFAFNWVAQGSTTLTASATGITTLTQSFSTGPAAAITMYCSYCTAGTGMTLPANGNGFYVQLSNPAPSGGLTVTLASSNTGYATVDPSVTIPAGNSYGYFQVNGIAVSVAGPPTLTASATGWTSGTHTVPVVAGEIRMYSYSQSKTTLTTPENVASQLTCNSGNYCGGATATVAVSYTITNATATVAFTNSTSSISAGDNVSDNAGVIGTPTSGGTYYITPAASGFTSFESLAVTVALPSITMYCSYCTVGAGMTLPANGNGFYVQLSNPAPSGGLTVTLASTNTPYATVDPSVTIPAGSTIGYFNVNGVTSNIDFPTSITASAAGWTSGSHAVTVLTGEIRMYSYSQSRTTLSAPESVSSYLTCNNGNYCGGATTALAVSYTITSATATVAFNNATATIAAGSNVSDNSGVVGTPGSGGTYTITPAVVGLTSIESAAVTVALPSITVNCSYCTVGAGMTLPNNGNGFYVQLSNPAASGGQVVNLSSSNTGYATVDASVTVAQGQTIGYFNVNGVAVSALGAPTITASAGGWTSGTHSVAVVQGSIQMYSYATSKTTLTAPEQVSSYLTCNNGNYCGGATNTLAVTYAIKAGNTASVTFTNASGSFSAGSNVSDNAGVIGTPTSGGTYQITPSASGFTSVDSNTVTVALPSITVNCSYCTVGVGMTLPANGNGFYVVLSNAAPTGGLTVNLASTSTAIATVQPTVVVAAGQTIGYFTVTGVVANAVQIQASATSWSGNSHAVTVVQPEVSVAGLTVSRNLASESNLIGALLTCSGGNYCGEAASDITVTFSVASASPSGIVTLTSAIATVPTGGNSSTTYGVVSTPTATGTYKITPSASGFTSVQSSTVTVTNNLTVNGSGAVGVGTTRSDLYYVQVNDAVGSPLLVTLTSSDPTKVVVTTVTINTGQSYAYFSVQGVGVGSATVTASVTGWSSGSATVTVN